MKKAAVKKARVEKSKKKKGASWPENPSDREAMAVARTTTFPPNGDMPSSGEVLPEKVAIGEAMRRAVEALGDVQIDDDLAPSQLRQLGEIIEDITRRQAAFNLKNDEAKTAKKSLESAQELLILMCCEFTHPSPLPLFDQKQAEDDHAEMLDADEKARQDASPSEASI